VIPVMLDVVLRRLVRMVRRMHAVPVRRVGMMRGFFVVAGNVMFGGLAMMSRGAVVVLRGGLMMAAVTPRIHRILL
jgi:hypothetical protein